MMKVRGTWAQRPGGSAVREDQKKKKKKKKSENFEEQDLFLIAPKGYSACPKATRRDYGG